MKYTVKTFIRAFVGDFKSLQKAFGNSEIAKIEPILLFDGDYIRVYCKEQGHDRDCPLDRISCSKRGKKLSIDLLAKWSWFMEFEFSDGGLIKNKEYKISDAFR